MIKFQDVTVADKATIEAFTLYGERQNCDLSIANLISWRFLYNTQFAIVDDYLVFRFYAGHHLAYMLPIPRPTADADGKLSVKPCDECSLNVIRAIREDATAMGHPFLMMGVCNYMVDLIEQVFPDTFDIKPDRDYADYVYTREKLVNLSGKKLHGKRNHINKFKSLYPDYVYKPLTPELVPECLRLAELWRDAAVEERGDAERLAAELRSMSRAFEFWQPLGLTGGTLFVDNKLVAFTYGCPINHNTFDVCVEKADVSYEGAFTVINNDFVRHLPEQFFYINREEDMGEEGLRRAKLSYKPDILLEKNVVMERHPLAAFEDQERIKQETIELWQEAFDDKEAFVQLYFERVYAPQHNFTVQIEGKVAGALQALPYTLKLRGGRAEAVYISGVSTRAALRQLNIGNNLMRQAHFNTYHKGAVFAVLIPAEPWLCEWYGKCGYVPKISSVPPPGDVLQMSYEQFDAWQQAQTSVLLQNSVQFDVAQEDVRIDGADYRAADKAAQGMIRVINAYRALQLYARANPAYRAVLRVKGDRDIPTNNTYYVVENGKVRRTDEPFAGAKVLSINQLAELLFAREQPVMTLMLN